MAFGAPYPDPIPGSTLLLETLLRQRPPGKGTGAEAATFTQAVAVVDRLLEHESPTTVLKEPVDDGAEPFADSLIRALIYRLVAANESFKDSFEADGGVSSFDVGIELDKFDRVYDLVKEFQRTARVRASRPFDAVLCDVDGVVRDWPPMEPIELAHGVVPGTLYTAAFAAHRLHPAITGQVTDPQWRALVTEDLAASDGITLETARSLVAAWSAIRATRNENVVALLELVREVIPVVLISNATDRLEADLTELGMEEFIGTLINTSRIGVAKPDPRIYAHAAELVGVPPERCLFVDDSAENVEAARAAGMQAVHFRETADLDDALRPLFPLLGS